MIKKLFLNAILFSVIAVLSHYSHAESINEKLKIPNEIDVASYTQQPFVVDGLKDIHVYLGRSDKEGNLLILFIQAPKMGLCLTLKKRKSLKSKIVRKMAELLTWISYPKM